MAPRRQFHGTNEPENPAMGCIGDPKRIPFDFAQGRLSCLAALGRRNDNGVSIGFVRVSSKAKWTVVENALRFGE
jgi:hypothetical protein